MFNVSNAPKADSSSKGSPSLEPGIYTGNLVRVEQKEIEGKEDRSYNVLSFLFRNTDGNEHEHYEWMPQADTDTGKIENMLARIKHVMKRFVPEEINAIESGQREANFQDWNALCRWVISTLDPKLKDTQVRFKIVGNVYNGNASSGFPGYPNFLARAGEDMSFSKRERENNQAYERFQANASNPGGGEDAWADAPAGSEEQPSW